MDEQARVLDLPFCSPLRVRLIAAGVVAVVLCACRFTEAALVTVLNETSSDITVYTLLPSDGAGDDVPIRLAAHEEGAVVKYEEPRGEVLPLSANVRGIRVVTDDCTVVVTGASIRAASHRRESRRHWVIRVAPETLRALGCGP
jgi:hypothetical protein